MWVQMSEGDQLRSPRTLLSRSKLLWSKKDPTIIKVFFCGTQIQKKPTPYLWIPVFTLRDVYKYFWKREMTCLCNIRLDLQSDAIVEPKTKAWVIFLTNVNRRCSRQFTVEHWNKMWGLLDCVCWVSLLCIGKNYWLICQERSVIASWKLFSLAAVIN